MSIKINKKAVAKFSRNILISFSILLALFIGAGVAYTWYIGQNVDASSAIAVPVENNGDQVIKPTQPGDNVKVGISIQVPTLPVIQGSNASISIKTKPGAICSIEVVYNEIKSTDTGLVAKTADDWGIVSWSWTVEKAVPIGKWPVNMTCAKGDLSGFMRDELKVVSQIE